MLKQLKKLILSTAAFGMIAAPVLVPAGAAFAATASSNNLITSHVCNGVQTATTSSQQANLSNTDNNGCGTGNVGTTGISNLLKLVINIFSIIVGFVAVVMIIWGGVKYITSGGESSNVSGAKNTIVYAIIGLIIVALAQLIVHFVLEKSASVY